MEISVTRALVALKRLDVRIDNAITRGMFSNVMTGSGAHAKIPGTTKTVTDIQRTIQGDFDSVVALLAHKSELKSKIVLSNATTRIMIMNRDVTVAEAIEMKVAINQTKQFVARLRLSLAQSRNSVITMNVKMEDNIEKLLSSMFGSDRTSVEVTEIETVTSTQKAMKESFVVAEDFTESRIIEMDKQIETIESEIDFILSESNSRTMIEINLI